jgi:hypothetical protein
MVMNASPILHIDFLRRADEFRDAYRRLPSGNRPPPDWAKYLLFYHALELALKAYLIQRGMTERQLGSKHFGHDLKLLVDEAVKRGLSLPHGCRDMIAALSEQNPSNSVPTHLLIRYPPHGPVYVLGQFEPYLDQLLWPSRALSACVHLKLGQRTASQSTAASSSTDSTMRAAASGRQW